MEHNFLNVSILQTEVSGDTQTNFSTISTAVDNVMCGYIKPELVLGVEFGIGKTPITITDDIFAKFAEIAKKYSIYFIPGTFAEASKELPEGEFYNTCPIFAPSGEMIAVYRKKVPFRPGEMSTPSDTNDYCLFEIAEKNIKVGVIICYEQFFPEIPRTLALMGADIILCPALDPMEYKHIPEIIPQARALENELFYIWTCGAGQFGASSLCGGSVIVNPEGEIVFKCSERAQNITRTLDMSMVDFKRNYGRDQHIKSLKQFNVQYPFANKIADAPIYNNKDKLTMNANEYKNKVKEINFGTI